MTILPALIFLLSQRAYCAPSTPAIALSSSTLEDPYPLIRSTVSSTPELANVPWFPESLEYKVHWGILAVGSANLQPSVVEDFNGSPAVRIVSQAVSNKFCDSFYKV